MSGLGHQARQPHQGDAPSPGQHAQVVTTRGPSFTRRTPGVRAAVGCSGRWKRSRNSSPGAGWDGTPESRQTPPGTTPSGCVWSPSCESCSTVRKRARDGHCPVRNAGVWSTPACGEPDRGSHGQTHRLRRMNFQGSGLRGTYPAVPAAAPPGGHPPPCERDLSRHSSSIPPSRFEALGGGVPSPKSHPTGSSGPGGEMDLQPAPPVPTQHGLRSNNTTEPCP